MVAYPVRFDWDGEPLHACNGDGYGWTGLGIAEWRDE